MKITWFRHNHENRNDLLRFGLMELHFAGRIRYIERPFNKVAKNDFAQNVMDYKDLRHLSFLIIDQKGKKIKCIVDNEDSFALVSPLLKSADIYFCAGYNSDFFEHKRFVQAYTWQDKTDLQWYRKTLEQKIECFGDHFYKIKKFIPIAPNLGSEIKLPYWKQKVNNLGHKVNRLVGKSDKFSSVYESFKTRYQYLNSLRDQPLLYDITLSDTLWGWPNHRVNLHRQLELLHYRGHKIHSILRWADGVENDGSRDKKLEKKHFPMTTKPLQDNYETMLAQSRLAVFACGFHWGWRNIMMFALMVGIPVLTDRLLTEAYFDFNEFYLYMQEDHLWQSIENCLAEIDEEKLRKIKVHNQTVYDKYMAPENVGLYFTNTINEFLF